LNLLSRQKVWTKRFRAPLASSLLLTKGRLLFSGDRDRFFRALDQDTGETLWQTRLNGVPNSSPITYSVGHRQFVAVVSGGGGPHEFDVNEMTPEIINSTASITIWVFALQALQ
jgi:alcohol dehydrogenase (cytochrome c)